ncbi:MAG: hypothetical protein MHM6MM_001417 [Cercozoa sp. M6MM]
MEIRTEEDISRALLRVAGAESDDSVKRAVASVLPGALHALAVAETNRDVSFRNGVLSVLSQISLQLPRARIPATTVSEMSLPSTPMALNTFLVFLQKAIENDNDESSAAMALKHATHFVPTLAREQSLKLAAVILRIGAKFDASELLAPSVTNEVVFAFTEFVLTQSRPLELLLRRFLLQLSLRLSADNAWILRTFTLFVTDNDYTSISTESERAESTAPDLKKSVPVARFCLNTLLKDASDGCLRRTSTLKAHDRLWRMASKDNVVCANLFPLNLRVLVALAQESALCTRAQVRQGASALIACCAKQMHPRVLQAAHQPILRFLQMQQTLFSHAESLRLRALFALRVGTADTTLLLQTARKLAENGSEKSFLTAFAVALDAVFVEFNGKNEIDRERAQVVKNALLGVLSILVDTSARGVQVCCKALGRLIHVSPSTEAMVRMMSLAAQQQKQVTDGDHDGDSMIAVVTGVLTRVYLEGDGALKPLSLPPVSDDSSDEFFETVLTRAEWTHALLSHIAKSPKKYGILLHKVLPVILTSATVRTALNLRILRRCLTPEARLSDETLAAALSDQSEVEASVRKELLDTLGVLAQFSTASVVYTVEIEETDMHMSLLKYRVYPDLLTIEVLHKCIAHIESNLTASDMDACVKLVQLCLTSQTKQFEIQSDVYNSALCCLLLNMRNMAHTAAQAAHICLINTLNERVSEKTIAALKSSIKQMHLPRRTIAVEEMARNGDFCGSLVLLDVPQMKRTLLEIWEQAILRSAATRLAAAINLLRSTHCLLAILLDPKNTKLPLKTSLNTPQLREIVAALMQLGISFLDASAPTATSSVSARKCLYVATRTVSVALRCGDLLDYSSVLMEKLAEETTKIQKMRSIFQALTRLQLMKTDSDALLPVLLASAVDSEDAQLQALVTMPVWDSVETPQSTQLSQLTKQRLSKQSVLLRMLPLCCDSERNVSAVFRRLFRECSGVAEASFDRCMELWLSQGDRHEICVRNIVDDSERDNMEIRRNAMILAHKISQFNQAISQVSELYRVVLMALDDVHPEVAHIALNANKDVRDYCLNHADAEEMRKIVKVSLLQIDARALLHPLSIAALATVVQSVPALLEQTHLSLLSRVASVLCDAQGKGEAQLGIPLGTITHAMDVLIRHVKESDAVPSVQNALLDCLRRGSPAVSHLIKLGSLDDNLVSHVLHILLPRGTEKSSEESVRMLETCECPQSVQLLLLQLHLWYLDTSLSGGQSDSEKRRLAVRTLRYWSTRNTTLPAGARRLTAVARFDTDVDVRTLAKAAAADASISTASFVRQALLGDMSLVETTERLVQSQAYSLRACGLQAQEDFARHLMAVIAPAKKEKTELLQRLVRGSEALLRRDWEGRKHAVSLFAFLLLSLCKLGNPVEAELRTFWQSQQTPVDVEIYAGVDAVMRKFSAQIDLSFVLHDMLLVDTEQLNEAQISVYARNLARFCALFPQRVSPSTVCEQLHRMSSRTWPARLGALRALEVLSSLSSALLLTEATTPRIRELVVLPSLPSYPPPHPSPRPQDCRSRCCERRRCRRRWPL